MTIGQTNKRPLLLMTYYDPALDLLELAGSDCPSADLDTAIERGDVKQGDGMLLFYKYPSEIVNE